jgi:transposase-like protein
MTKPYENISLVQFQRKFRTEKDCKKRLFKMRWSHGFICPRCGYDQYYELSKRGLYQCKACKYQCSLTAGTVMHRTRTPLRKWFWAIFLFSNDKRGISALQLSEKLTISYWVAWTMLHKIRKAMKDRDAHYQLAGLIEVDDSYIGTSSKGDDKRGRGTKKIPVLIAASTNGKGIGYAKMQIVDSLHSEPVRRFLQANVTAHQTIRTDGWQSYNVAEQMGHAHEVELILGRKAHDVLKWVHILASNAKAFILGTYHGLDRKHLQSYLDEYCFRFNRRNTGAQLFDRLLMACVSSRGLKYSELTQ